MNQVEKYLSRYAEPEARQSDFHNQAPDQFDHVLVIPAYSETLAEVTRTWQALEGNFLVIVVVNSPEPDEATEQLAQDLAKESLPNVMVIDRFSESRRIPPRQGVGLARKVGCDVALSLIAAGVVRDSWIFTTDADVTLPADYFEIPKRLLSKSAAAVFPFRHVAEAAYADACQAYELSMLYYAAGIRWAESKYAYTTIGSTLAFSANHYAGVRGFPKRNTGEDFYLLNKLRKSAPITSLEGPIITISGRVSERVPIGTGRAIEKINASGETASIEHPDCYVALKEVLSWMKDLAARQTVTPKPQDRTSEQILDAFGFFEHYENKRAQSPSQAVMEKHLTDWFDALKTRQFIHRARDLQYGLVPITDPGPIPFAPSATNIEMLHRACRKRVFGA